MRIYIPTRARWSKQITYGELTPALRAKTTFVVDHDQIPLPHQQDKYKVQGTEILAVPLTVKGIAATRQHIMEVCPEPYLVMLDDDLTLHTRNAERKIVKATDSEVDAMFAQMEQWLEAGFAHCSITPRFLNWQDTEPYKDVTRMMHVLAYNVPKVQAAGASFTAGVPESFSMDDFHMTLQLFRAGLPNRVDLAHCTSPSASNSTGGASTWRSLASHNASAQRLADIHGPYVKVKRKQDWKGMASGERLDVVVQWQKAYASAGKEL